MKTLSNYYITVPYIAPLSGLTCTRFTLNVFIWSGLKWNFTPQPTYQITKDNISGSVGSTKIDIYQIVSDFISFQPEVSNTTEVINGSNQIWVRVSTYYATTDPLDLTTETNEVTELATKGYSYGNEGENAGFPSSKILIPIIDYKVHKKFIVPVLIDEVNISPYSVISYPNNAINLVGAIPSSVNSNNMIKNIFIEVDEAINEDYIEVIYNSQTITLLIEKECRYTPIDILFQNKEGVAMVLPFFKKRTESMDITSEEFESDRGQPKDGFHQYTTYNVQARSKFNVNSGFVDESMNEVFKQLLLSERIWLFENDSIIPINIDSKTLEYKNRVNDRLINYNIAFKYSYNEINNV